MASPEQIFHRPRVVFVPDEEKSIDASGQTGNENFQQQATLSEPNQFLSPLQPHTQGLGFTPERQSSEPVEDFATFRAERRARWKESREVPPIVGGAANHPPESPKQEKTDDDSEREPENIWPPERTDTVYLDLGLNRAKDLSPEANWLVERLLAGAVDYGEELDYLHWRAAKDGIDLQVALDELNAHNLIVSRKPGWIDLPRKVFPSKDR